MRNLHKSVKTIRPTVDGVNFKLAAGTGDTSNGDWIDTSGFGGLAFIALFGALTATAVTSIKLQHSNDAGATDAAADIAGTANSIPVANANGMLIVEIFKPQKRYVRLVITRATANAVIDGVIAELYLPQNAPVTQDASVASIEFFNTPLAGTA